MMSRLAVAFLAAAAGCLREDSGLQDDSTRLAERAAACAGGEGVLDGYRIGSIRLGMPVDSAIALCPAAHDTIEFNEGEPGRVLVARIAGDTIRIRIHENAVHSILVETPRFATQDSLRAGMPVGRLLSLPELTGGSGEGVVYVWSTHESACGLSFRLDDRTAGAQLTVRKVSPASLAPYAASGRVTAILVRGC